MKKTVKLQLHRDTLRNLEAGLSQVRGGIISTDNIFDCGTKLSGPERYGAAGYVD
ncbi:MAG TPA: hypothetical protein VHU81_03470 [Thermoanaerobaculia bacterium]|jgi:hypothetical protein|nr:hypothetical protein [Thermoanaerobaculia bacterium]